MISPANKNIAAGSGADHLCMTTQAKIRIGFDEQICIYGTVGIVTDRAAFAQRGMLINKRLGFLLMTLRARLVQPRHGEPAFRFHDVHAMRVVALDTIHFSFQDGVMVWKTELRRHVQMTFQTGLRVFAGVNDEFFQAAAARHGDVFAAGAMARFATKFSPNCDGLGTQSGVCAGGKGTCDILVAIGACRVPDEGGAIYLQWGDHCAIARGTGRKKSHSCAHCQRHRGQPGQSLLFNLMNQGFCNRPTR